MENKILRMIMEEIKNKEHQYEIIFLYFLIWYAVIIIPSEDHILRFRLKN